MGKKQKNIDENSHEKKISAAHLKIEKMLQKWII